MDGGGQRVAVATGPTEEPGPVRSMLTSPFNREILVLLAAAAVVQALFWVRHDWPAHLVAGGAMSLGVFAVSPRRVASWTGPLGFVAVLAAAVLTELTVFNPFDPVDIAVTVLGSLFVAGAGADVALAPRRHRRCVLQWSALLIGASLVYRFGLDPRHV
jgi:hypothetical protein